MEKFTLNDFRQQMQQIKKLGPLREVMKLIPGPNGFGDAEQLQQAEDELRRVDGIINAMTPGERANPDEIDLARIRRIAYGSGVDASDVQQMIKQFREMRSVMKRLRNMGK